MKKFLYFGLLFLVFSCFNKSDKVIIPHDFCFIITGETEEINSYHSTIKRKYSLRDTTITVEFTKAELENIYNAMLKYKILELPIYLETKHTFSLPDLETTLRIEMNGKVHLIKLSNNTKSNCESRRLRKFLKVIYDILLTKKEYKNLPETNILFR